MMNDKNNLKISHIVLICFAQPTFQGKLFVETKKKQGAEHVPTPCIFDHVPIFNQ